MRTRVSDKYLKELISNEGELATGPISALGILRLALDLHDARALIKGMTEASCPNNQSKKKTS